MALFDSTADVLERAIAGDDVDDPRVADLLPTTRALASLPLAVRPDPAFVARLAERLRQEAAAIAAETAAAGSAAAAPDAGVATSTRPRLTIARPASGARRTTSRPSRPSTGATRGPAPHPAIVFIGRGLPRVVAGIAASIVAVAAIVGVTSRSALPGQVLYPVKQVIDQAQVGLAGSDLAKGDTLLSQAQGHVVEVSQLVDESSTDASDVNIGLVEAITKTQRGQELLRSVTAPSERGPALLSLRDFTTRMTPQLDALAGVVPAGSADLLAQLRALVGQLTTATDQALAACQDCGLGAAASGLSPGSGGAGATGTVPSSGSTAAVAPGSAVSATAGSGQPGGAAGLPSAPTTVAVPGVGVGNSTAGAGVQLPGVGVSTDGATIGGGGAAVTVPGVTATVGVPTVTVGTGGVEVGGGGVGLGGSGSTVTVPVPGVTVGSGGIGVGGIPVVTNTCVLGLCGGQLATSEAPSAESPAAESTGSGHTAGATTSSATGDAETP